MYGKLSMATAATFLVLAIGCSPDSTDRTPPQSNRSARSETSSGTVVDKVPVKPTPSSRTPVSSSSDFQIEYLEDSNAADGLGSLSGRILLNGSVEPAKLAVTKDQEFCGQHNLVDESYVVGSDGGLANAVVSLYLQRGQDPPGEAAALAQAVVLDNHNCRFDPRVCAVQTGQTLLIGNKDPVGHNTKIDMQSNPSINPLIPAGGSLEQHFSQPERRPAQVSCSIHPWMVGWVVVSDHPFVAVTNGEGGFEIKNLPAGDWTFQLWHEKANVNRAVQNGQSVEIGRGRFTVAIQSGMTADVGEIELEGGE